MRKVASLCLFFGSLVACGQNPGQDAAHPSYRLGGTQYAGLTRKVHDDTITVCYSDSTNSARHQADVKDAVLQWVDALKGVADTDAPLTTTVELVDVGQPCDASVYIGNYAPAYTEIGSTPSLHLNYSGWYGSQTVTLHEMGHAFGLLDTYNGSGGSCQAGQPSSVMCYASFPELQADDIAGVRRMYALLEQGLAGDAPDVEGQIVY